MAKADAAPTSRANVRRSVILATAWSVFVDQGYGGTSMAQIAERLGGSKATLYSYFSWDLCSASAQRRVLLMIGARLASLEIGALADRAVRIFLAAYDPDTASPAIT